MVCVISLLRDFRILVILGFMWLFDVLDVSVFCDVMVCVFRVYVVL